MTAKDKALPCAPDSQWPPESCGRHTSPSPRSCRSDSRGGKSGRLTAANTLARMCPRRSHRMNQIQCSQRCPSGGPVGTQAAPTRSPSMHPSSSEDRPCGGSGPADPGLRLRDWRRRPPTSNPEPGVLRRTGSVRRAPHVLLETAPPGPGVAGPGSNPSHTGVRGPLKPRSV